MLDVFSGEYSENTYLRAPKSHVPFVLSIAELLLHYPQHATKTSTFAIHMCTGPTLLGGGGGGSCTYCLRAGGGGGREPIIGRARKKVPL